MQLRMSKAEMVKTHPVTPSSQVSSGVFGEDHTSMPLSSRVELNIYLDAASDTLLGMRNV